MLDKKLNIIAKTPIPDNQQRLRVGFILLENFTLNAFSGFIEAIRLSADKGGRSRQINCGWEIMGRKTVTASCGLKVTPSSDLIDPSNFDYIAVCGGNDYQNHEQPKWFNDYLFQAEAAGVSLIGLCTGTFNIARAGLMKGFIACVHWNVFESFREQFPSIDALPDRIFIDAGKRITCAGSAGASDLALHLIVRHCGHDKAQQSIRHMMLQEIRPATHPQAHFYSDLEGVRDDRVRRAVQFMEQSLNDPIAMPRLAELVGSSQRQLERCFAAEFSQTPATYFRHMRLKYGAFLLTHTRLTATEIAHDAGFSDAAHFSREFKALFEATPRAFRDVQKTTQNMDKVGEITEINVSLSCKD